MLIFTLFGLLVNGLPTPDSLAKLMLKYRDPNNIRPLPFPSPLKMRGNNVQFPRPITDSVIRSDFLCNDDTIGGCQQRTPDIAIDRTGNFVVVWCDFRDGDADVWFQRFNSGGEPLGRNERINTDVTLGWQGDPAVAMATGSGFICSWEDRRDIGNSDVFCQRFDSIGNRLADNFRVSDSGVPGDQSISSVCVAPDGTTLVVWDDRRYGLTGDIFAQFLNPDGTRRGTNFRVNDDGVGIANQYEPDVSCDDSGKFVVVWMDGRGNNPSDWNIFCQRFAPDGTRLGGNLQVTTNDSIQWTPRVSASPRGWFVICWDDRRRGEWDVYARIYNNSGQPLGGDFRIPQEAGTSDQYGGAVAINFYGEWLAVWVDKRNGDEDIYAQRFDSVGNRLGEEFRINLGGDGNQNSPAVVASPDGGYWVTWCDYRLDNYDIYCQRIARDGSLIGTNFKVNDDSASAHQRISSIAMEKGGNICITWEDERGISCDIYRAVFDSLGRECGANLRLNDDLGTAAQYYASVAGGNGRFLVAWSDNRNGWDIYAQLLDREGYPLGTNFRVNAEIGNTFQWYPYCAMDSFNRAAIVWMDYRNGGSQIYARIYDENGNPTGDEFPVSDSSAACYYASVAMNAGGFWVVAWMDYRDGGDANIYCQLFRPDGSRIGSNIRVNRDTGRVYQGYPSCAIAENRSIAVVWEDTRNGCYNVYLQWFDSTGNFLGNNERVDENSGEIDCYSPSCDFDELGRLVVVFNDEREATGNPQIYCQRFDPDRSRAGHNVKINEPNLFPKNTHWTVGQSVVANSSRVAFTWTENRRHRGWDIYGKLTDWNLIGVEQPLPTPPFSNKMATIVSRRQQLALTPEFPNAVVRIYDISGRQLYCSRCRFSSEGIQLQNFRAGVYFFEVTQGGAIKKRIKLIFN